MAKAILPHIMQEPKCTAANFEIILRSLWIPLKQIDLGR